MRRREKQDVVEAQLWAKVLEVCCEEHAGKLAQAETQAMKEATRWRRSEVHWADLAEGTQEGELSEAIQDHERETHSEARSEARDEEVFGGGRKDLGGIIRIEVGEQEPQTGWLSRRKWRGAGDGGTAKSGRARERRGKVRRKKNRTVGDTGDKEATRRTAQGQDQQGADESQEAARYEAVGGGATTMARTARTGGRREGAENEVQQQIPKEEEKVDRDVVQCQL